MDGGCSKTGARVSACQHFLAGALCPIARDSGLVRGLCAKLAKPVKGRASVKTLRASVKLVVFTHTSFARAPNSAKKQQELAMCRR